MDPPAIVIDSGSSVMKVGFAGEDAPRSVFPSIVGRPRYEKVLVGGSSEDDFQAYVGMDAESKRGALTLNYPMHNKTVADWEGMGLIWKYSLEDKLHVHDEEGDKSVLLTVGPLSQNSMRQKMLQEFMDTFGMSRVSFWPQAVLSLYASGRHSGMVVDSGHDVTHVVPINEGSILVPQVRRFDLAGHFVTNALAQLLHHNGHNFVTSAEMEIVRDMKEKLVYVALDCEHVMQVVRKKNLEPSKYELPDGTLILVPPERFLCAETLFDQRRVMPGFDADGLGQVVHQSASLCPEALRECMYHNIVLAGGNTLLPNFETRLLQEIEPLAPGVVAVVAPPERKYSAWIGGSILASLPAFDSQWITKAEYAEFGPGIVNRKFI